MKPNYRYPPPDANNFFYECLSVNHKIPEWEPAKDSWMGTLQGLGHPLFSPPFRNGNVIDHASGAVTGHEPPLSYGWGWIVPPNPESRFGKGVRLFWLVSRVTSRPGGWQLHPV
jgi:hypothetical protein